MLHCEHLAKTLKEMPSEKKTAKNEMLKTSSLSRYISDLILKVEYPFFISLAVQCSVEVRDQFQLELWARSAEGRFWISCLNTLSLCLSNCAWVSTMIIWGWQRTDQQNKVEKNPKPFYSFSICRDTVLWGERWEGPAVLSTGVGRLLQKN